MKQLPIRKENSSPGKKKSLPATWEPGILADSLEVMEEHTVEKIRGLENALNQLTIADHTHEIIALCNEIKQEKVLLEQIALRKRRSRYLC